MPWAPCASPVAVLLREHSLFYHVSDPRPLTLSLHGNPHEELVRPRLSMCGAMAECFSSLLEILGSTLGQTKNPKTTGQNKQKTNEERASKVPPHKELSSVPSACDRTWRCLPVQVLGGRGERSTGLGQPVCVWLGQQALGTMRKPPNTGLSSPPVQGSYLV